MASNAYEVTSRAFEDLTEAMHHVQRAQRDTETSLQQLTDLQDEYRLAQETYVESWGALSLEDRIRIQNGS